MGPSQSSFISASFDLLYGLSISYAQSLEMSIEWYLVGVNIGKTVNELA